jgi:hypothetical protein
MFLLLTGLSREEASQLKMVVTEDEILQEVLQKFLEMKPIRKDTQTRS